MLTLFLIITAAIAIEHFWSPRLEVVSDTKYLYLFYNAGQFGKRSFVELFKLPF